MTNDFAEQFSGLADEELARRALRGELVAEAEAALLLELSKRGISDLTAHRLQAAKAGWAELAKPIAPVNVGLRCAQPNLRLLKQIIRHKLIPACGVVYKATRNISSQSIAADDELACRRCINEHPITLWISI